MGTASRIAAGDLVCRLHPFDSPGERVEEIIPDLNGGVNHQCIGSKPNRGAKLFRYEFSRSCG
jgi:hypothetical protein